MTSSALHGVIPPLVTPRDADGNLDTRSLIRLVHHQIAAGVDGLFVGGSTGEAVLLDEPTRLAALDVAVTAADGRVPVLYGVIDPGTMDACARAAAAADHGAAMVVATVPFYVRPHPSEIVAHFAAIARSTTLPVVAYDIPSATHVTLSADTTRDLLRSGAVAGLKDSSGDLEKLRDVLDDAPLPVLTGSETLTDVALDLGAAGVVPGLGNVDPAGYVRLYRAIRSGDRPTARREQDRLRALFGIVQVADRSRIGFTAAALGGFKSAMTYLRLTDHPATWPPLSALTDGEHARIAELVDRHLPEPNRVAA